MHNHWDSQLTANGSGGPGNNAYISRYNIMQSFQTTASITPA